MYDASIAGGRTGQPRDREAAGPPYARIVAVTAVPRDVLAVALAQLVVVALVVGWFATGHASAPDDGLLQLDVLSLHERLPGLSAENGRPTMVVVTGPPTAHCLDEVQWAQDHPLPPAYSRVLVSDPAEAERLALPAAARRCQPGYVLLDATGLVRYRSYDPGWAHHLQEQEILLENLR